MRRSSILKAFTAAMSISGSSAIAEPDAGLRGVFCINEASRNGVIALMQSGVGEAVAVESLNDKVIRCTQATLITYVVDEVTEDVAGLQGFRTYRATLVAVIVGKAVRPVEPPVPVYFYRPFGAPVLDAGQRL